MARPQQFDREVVLQKAMQLFWQQGYAATSMSELIAAMDMRPGSIYSAFENKQALLLEVLDYYSQQGHAQVCLVLDEAKSSREAFARLLASMVHEMTCETPAKGCLIVNMLLELSNVNEEAGAHLRRHLQATKDLFRQALVKADEAGELRPGQNPDVAAVFLLGTVYSLRVMGRAAASQEEMRILCDQSIHHVFLNQQD